MYQLKFLAQREHRCPRTDGDSVLPLLSVQEIHREIIMGNNLLSLKDFSKPQLQSLIVRAMRLKKEAQDGVVHRQLAGKTIALLFEKPSTRTRVSFEAAMYGLGGQVIFMPARETQLGRGEPLKDTARVLSRYVDGLVVRTFGQEVVEELARFSDIPVINALTDLHHPCQVLSDLMTVIEKKGAPEHLKIVWLGDGNNMANYWIEAAAVFGFPLTLACPEGYDPDAAILEHACNEEGAEITLVRDPVLAVEGADIVNVDVWASMGQEEEQEMRLEIFAPYQLNRELLARAGADALVLHCLPAHRGEEITDDVLESEQSVVFDQAENKMHMHKAILETCLTGGYEGV